MKIIENCKLHCVWMKIEKDREEYAIDMLVKKIYRDREGFPLSELEENTAFVFEF